MKKSFFLAAMLSLCFLFSLAVDNVNAADVGYSCTMNSVGAGRDGVGVFNMSCPALSATPKWFISEPASAKSFLAIGLTASSIGKNVYIVIDGALGEWQPIKQFYLLP